MAEEQSVYMAPNRDDDIHPIDSHIGRKMRLLRTLAGKTQTDLAELLGVTYQQVQKYETGQSRMMATRLFEFAKKMGVAIDYFFEGLASEGGLGEEKQQGLEGGDEPLDRASLELLRTFIQIQNPRARRLIVDLARTLAEEGKDMPLSKAVGE